MLDSEGSSLTKKKKKMGGSGGAVTFQKNEMVLGIKVIFPIRGI